MRGWRVGMLAAILATGAIAPSAHARIYQVTPADSDGPNDSFVESDALWAVGHADVLDGVGQLCVVEESVSSGACDEDVFWGRPNVIGVEGTFLQPIAAAHLQPGTYRILADNGDDNDVVSEPFYVDRCPGGAQCASDIADGQLAEWKDAASGARTGMAVMCLASTIHNADGDTRKTLGEGVLNDGLRKTIVAEILQDSSLELSFEVPPSTEELALTLLQRVSCGAFVMYDDIVADPPDADFEHVGEAPEENYFDVQSGAAAADEAVRQLEHARANGIAQRVSVERFEGADQGGDAGWAALHERRVGAFGLQLNRGMRRAVDDLRSYASELDAADVSAASASDVSAARILRARVGSSGFTPGELDRLRALGLSETEIGQLRVQLSAPLPAGATGGDPADALRHAADGLEAESCVAAGSSCRLDEFARTAGAAGANSETAPRLIVPASPHVTEGDRGVNHARFLLRLSRPSEVAQYGTIAIAGDHPSVHPPEGSFGYYFAPYATRAATGVTFDNDNAAEGDETVDIDITPATAAAPDGPLTLTIEDDDDAAAPRAGRRGLIAYTANGYTTFAGEPTGSDLLPGYVSDDELGIADWSADRRRLLLHRNARDLADQLSGGQGYYTLPVDALGRPTGAATRITPAGELWLGAHFSPDGTKLVGSRYGGQAEYWKLAVQSIDSGGGPAGAPTPVADSLVTGWQQQFAADFSPAGNRIVFDGCTNAGRCGLFTAAVDSNGHATAPPQDLVVSADTRAPVRTLPSWSPDGRFVAYEESPTDNLANAEVDRIPVTSAGAPNGSRAQLSPTGANTIGAPAWAPDSRAVAFMTGIAPEWLPEPHSGEGSNTIVTIELAADGTAQGSLRAVSPYGLYPGGDGAVWSPASPAPTPTPSPTPTPTPTPSPERPVDPVHVTPPAGPPAPPAATPHALAAATLPSNRRCVSRRRFRIRLARSPGDPIVRVVVRVKGKKVQTIRGRKLSAPVDLRGLPKGRFVVQVVATTVGGRTLKTKRAYRTCTKKRRAQRR